MSPHLHAGSAAGIACALLMACGGGSTSPAPDAGGGPWGRPQRSADGYLVDAADLNTRAALDQLGLGGPLFTAWNPADAPGGGMKIMLFGAAHPACPAHTIGPIGSFPDSVLVADGYPGAPAQVPADLRFWALPMAGCGAGAAGLAGPNHVYLDGSALWAGSSARDRPTDLLFPQRADGQTGDGANAFILDTSVDFNFDPERAPVAPWARNGRARIGILTEVSRLQAGSGPGLTQAMATYGVTLINLPCRTERPEFHCQLVLQYSPAVARSNVSDWVNHAPPPDPNVFGDRAMGGIGVIGFDQLPAAGQTLQHPASGLVLGTSRGSATRHQPFGPTQFDVEVDSTQLGNAVRIVSGVMVGQAGVPDAACAPCAQLYGSRWNDPAAWRLSSLYYHQEIYDDGDRAGEIVGSLRWLYAGPAP